MKPARVEPVLHALRAAAEELAKRAKEHVSTAHLLAAMAHYRSGLTGQATEQMRRAGSLPSAVFTQPGESDLGEAGVENWFVGRILLREAEELTGRTIATSRPGAIPTLQSVPPPATRPTGPPSTAPAAATLAQEHPARAPA